MVNIECGVSGASGFATCHTNMTPPFACEIVSVNSLLAGATSELESFMGTGVSGVCHRDRMLGIATE